MPAATKFSGLPMPGESPSLASIEKLIVTLRILIPQLSRPGGDSSDPKTRAIILIDSALLLAGQLRAISLETWKDRIDPGALAEKAERTIAAALGAACEIHRPFGDSGIAVMLFEQRDGE